MNPSDLHPQIDDSEYENKIIEEDIARNNKNDSSDSNSTLPLTDDDSGPEFDATAQGKLLVSSKSTLAQTSPFPTEGGAKAGEGFEKGN